ncbi:hypothetical protein [Methanoregula sp.]|uniref:hypothetical protein n=1 Tax=Methanoregula sp. TaxID=2052170 RepID=UPI00236D015B|nr:hypothetical protein [Methanoregula sp.]MDD1685516.1 hypothetical protein [Methanoregula sp.]
MGEKKKKEAAQNKWKKILFVAAAVLFVFVMVISSMGTHWITGIAPVKAGDSVVLEYTIYDASGMPFLTTDETLYEKNAGAGQAIMYGKDISLTANQSIKQAIYPVDVYSTNTGSVQQFALYNPEYNAISSGVVGMRTGEIKKIPLSTNSTMSALFSPEDLAQVHVNMSSLSIGDSLVMGVSETQNATATNSTAVSYLRLGDVTRINTNGVVVEFGYPYAEITLKSFTASNS